MPQLRIGVSTRALFDLEKEHQIFVREGTEKYVKYQMEHEEDILKPGPAFHLVEAFLQLGEEDVEIVIMSKNNADASLRIFHSIEAYDLRITRAVLTTGQPLTPYLKAFGIDLYLSSNEEDVREAVKEGVAAGLLLAEHLPESKPIRQIRIAFDGDAVLFSDEAEMVFLSEGVEAFCENEKRKALQPLPEGPFANFLKSIAAIQKKYPPEFVPLRTALVTARSAPAHERVIRTLRRWGIRVDEAFFLGGEDKSRVLKAFGAHIFFEDKIKHIQSASSVVLSAQVIYPYHTAILPEAANS